jgi:hypothetical protein
MIAFGQMDLTIRSYRMAIRFCIPDLQVKGLNFL